MYFLHNNNNNGCAHIAAYVGSIHRLDVLFHFFFLLFFLFIHLHLTVCGMRWVVRRVDMMNNLIWIEHNILHFAVKKLYENLNENEFRQSNANSIHFGNMPLIRARCAFPRMTQETQHFVDQMADGRPTDEWIWIGLWEMNENAVSDLWSQSLKSSLSKTCPSDDWQYCHTAFWASHHTLIHLYTEMAT